MAFGNERDVEVPALLAFLRELRPASLLDVGAFGTDRIYAHVVDQAMPGMAYDALDVIPADNPTPIPWDTYYHRDWLAVDLDELGSWEVVSCVSVLEHVGVKDERLPAPKLARRQFAHNLFQAASRGVLITCPFGIPGGIEGEYENITESDLRGFESLAHHYGFDVRCRFFIGDTPQGPNWREVRENVARQAGGTAGPFCVLIMECVK